MQSEAQQALSTFSVTMETKEAELLWQDYKKEKNSLWEGRVIKVQWDENKAATYQLHPLDRNPAAEIVRFRQPIASAYKAERRSVIAGEPQEFFVIKLPVLYDLKLRLNSVSIAYQQEYNLRDRFPPGLPSVLPELFPDERNEKRLESSHPYVHLSHPQLTPILGTDTIPCVVREFILGKSLDRWAREQANGDGQFYGLSSTALWFEVASALFKALGELHRERAAHGFIYPENILLRQGALQNGKLTLRDIVFTNAAESHRSVYFEASDTKGWEETKLFGMRRWYDSSSNLYRFAKQDGKWLRFDLDEGSDYYSATDIFSMGVTL